MLPWLASHTGDIIVSTILIIIVALILIKMLRDRKRGKSSCGCGCSDCALKGQCNRKNV